MPAEVTAQAVLVHKHLSDMKWKAPGHELQKRYAKLKKQHNAAKRKLAEWRAATPPDVAGQQKKATQIAESEKVMISTADEMKACEREALAVKW